MIKEIKYNGYTATPSDYECPDGDLAGMMNIVPDNGHLKPVLPPTTLFTLDGKKKVAFVHETAKFKHYIILDPTNNKMSWFDDGAEPSTDTGVIPTTELKTFGNKTQVHQVNAIGNTLIAQCDNGMHYFLWKGDKDGYLYLGTHLPELPISFGLQGEMTRSDEFTISFKDRITYKWKKNDTTANDPFCKEYTENNKNSITDQVLAQVNKFIAENVTNKGKFLYPFFVRYAYRLYDGSLTMHSAPILMACSSDCAPEVIIFSSHVNVDKDYADRSQARVIGVTHALDFACLGEYYIKQMKNWGDIVRSVDIFISKPIYTYDQNGYCKRFERLNEKSGYSVCKLTNQAIDTTKYPVRYQKQTYQWMYAKAFNTWDIGENAFMLPSYRVGLPVISTDTVKANVRSCSQFYLLESIKIEDLSTERKIIPVEDDYLQSLVAREVMSDDYDSHDTIVSKYSFAYNQRLNLTNIRKQLWKEFYSGSALTYTDGYVFDYSEPTYLDEQKYAVAVFYFIKQDGRDIVVKGAAGVAFGASTPVLYLYYPNVNCYKAIVQMQSYISFFYEVKMENHDFLNGSFYFGDWEGATKSENSFQSNLPNLSTDAERTIEIANKIYTSDVNNPFRFAVTNINTVGAGKILGISTAAKALSQGQFGQFPLYAFTTEGVWAMEVSTSTGSYSARQPITRDVCINPDSITQIDSAVLFATDRGIMLISGSESQCISDVLNGDKTFNPLSLPAGEELIKQAGFTTEQLNYVPFMDYLKDCGMLYDYTHQRIIVYNPNCKYAYVYSLKDKAWGMMPSNIEAGLNFYPEALAMTADGDLINLSDDDTSDESVLQGIKGLVFTRPFKLDGPDLLKTIDTIIQRGYMQKGHVQQVLYGSRDLFNWHAIWSSSDIYLRGFRGTPYKYFRLALLCQLDANESLYGFTCQFQPRLINQPR